MREYWLVALQAEKMVEYLVAQWAALLVQNSVAMKELMLELRLV